MENAMKKTTIADIENAINDGKAVHIAPNGDAQIDSELESLTRRMQAAHDRIQENLAQPVMERLLLQVRRELTIRFGLQDITDSKFIAEEFRRFQSQAEMSIATKRVSDFLLWLSMELKTNFILNPRFHIADSGSIEEKVTLKEQQKLDADGIPRRARIENWTAVEAVTHELMQKIEALGCHELLTDAVVLLSRAQGKLADWVELENK